MNQIDNRYWWGFLGMLLIVHLLGMSLIDIMEVDAVQYASISQEMNQTGEYLQVHHRYENYLDKPPLLFWVTSLSFKLLGTSNFSFRLPSFLFLLLGLFATNRLGKHLYNERVGKLAVLVLFSSQAYFLFSHDVRTDTILANVVIVAVWQLWLFIEQRKLSNLIWGAIAVSLAMLEKGPIGIMVPVLALGSQILYTRNLRVVWRWEWLLGLLVVVVMLAPMSYGLYKQFGIHGLEFYFWTQSFGRITGQSEWEDSSTIFYFIHNFLWAFLPWMLMAYFAIGRELIKLVRSKFDGKSPVEVITLGGFVLTFIAMSLSRYKLPHYIFVAFPLAAITTAKLFDYIIESGSFKKLLIPLQWFINTLLWIAVGLLVFISLPGASWYLLVISAVLLVGSFYYLSSGKTLLHKLVYSALLTIIGVNFLLNTHFYPTLLTYQSGSQAGRYVASMDVRPELYSHRVISHGLDFYSGRVAPLINVNEMAEHHGIWVYTTDKWIKEIDEAGVSYTVIKSFKYFHVTGLTMNFLNPDTRGSVVGERYLIRINHN